MLWYKSWLETRWRFTIGLALLLMLACGAVFGYPAVAKFTSSVGTAEAGGGVLGRSINEAFEAQRTYRGFIWYQWHQQNLAQMWTMFAVLLGSGGLVAKAAGGALFTLSLPASRTRLLGVRAATGHLQILALALIPSLLVPLLSPAVGQRYSIVDVMIHGTCLFVAGAAFFNLAFLLSTIFDDLWRPLLLACAVAVVLRIAETVVRDVSPYGIFHVMSAESYFRAGRLPWSGLFTSVALSLAMLYLATINFARRDF
jgi:ABC-2 type transport system permease protein